MKNLFWIVCLFSFTNAISQQSVKKDLVYGKATNWRNQLIELKLDIIYPSKGNKLPLIVYIHGGGFMEGSSKEPSFPFCDRLSRSGFVVANVEYRTGFEQSVQNYKTEISKAVYRAQQDDIAAIHYLVHAADEYGIDTSLIFIAGESAGGVTSLFSAYVSQEDWDKVAMPLHSALGSIDDSQSEYRDRFAIKGVISLWGGIADTSFISLPDMQKIPVLLFHSIDDEEIPFERASHSEAKQQLLFGSKDIAHRFGNNIACCQLYYIKEAGHSYGFSSDYISNAVKNFVDGIRAGKCSSLEIENKERNISVSFIDSDEALFPNEDDKVIRLANENLQQFAGKYEDNGTIVIMTVEGDHLKAQTPGPATFDLYPISENIFLERIHNYRIEFVKDPQGIVREHIVHLTKYKSFSFKKTG
jgi:predicted esterase